MIQSGQLDRKVTIQAKTISRDDFGGVVETWADVATRYARKIDQGGREFRAAGVTNAEVTTLFTMRYYAGLTPSHRILCGGRIYDILAVTEGSGRNAEAIVQAKGAVTQ